MLGWLLVVLALGALVFDPGLGGRVVAAAAVLAYLMYWSGGGDGDGSGALQDVTEIEPDEESHWSVRPPGWFESDAPGSSPGDTPDGDEEAR